MVCVKGEFVTDGVGLTVMVYVTAEPMQIPIVGTIEIVPVIEDVPEFVAVNDGVFPVPLATKPIAVFEFVHANVAPAGTLANAEAGTIAPLQNVIFVGGVKTGIGFTVIV
jgi:hypothetical protein